MKNKLYSFVSTGLVLGAMVLAPLGSIALADDAPAPTVTVTIDGYLDGQMATAASYNSNTFPMTASWSADNIGAGSGQYALSSTGFNSPQAYEAMTTDMSSGATYSTNEVPDGTIVGETCGTESTNPSYALVGYTTGDTMAEAQAGTPSLTVPNLTNITSNKFVIVWNKSCTAAPTTLKVHIMKYLDGAQATAASASSYLFPMTATWQAANVSGGSSASGSYTLGSNTDTNNLYEADTVAFDAPASYTTAEVADNTSHVLPIGATCVSGKYRLEGYKTSTISFADAQANGTLTSTAPNFTNISADEYVLVMNSTCGTSSGTIDGTVEGGIVPGTLAVTSVTTVNGTATADGTFANGWKYTFNITVPDTETHLAMKFSDWTNTSNASTISAANNIRISSAQADNSGATITLAAANTYSAPSLNMTGDLDAGMPGKQVQVTVEVAVPSTTLNGAYSTSYGVQTLP